MSPTLEFKVGELIKRGPLLNHEFVHVLHVSVLGCFRPVRCKKTKHRHSKHQGDTFTMRPSAEASITAPPLMICAA